MINISAVHVSSILMLQLIQEELKLMLDNLIYENVIDELIIGFVGSSSFSLILYSSLRDKIFGCGTVCWTQRKFDDITREP